MVTYTLQWNCGSVLTDIHMDTINGQTEKYLGITQIFFHRGNRICDTLHNAR